MLLGYDSRTAFTKAVPDIEDVAHMLWAWLEGMRENDQVRSRPLRFVSRSLGGIVVKKVSKETW